MVAGTHPLRIRAKFHNEWFAHLLFKAVLLYQMSSQILYNVIVVLFFKNLREYFLWQVRNPQRDLPLGIGIALFICCILYMFVSFVITGLVPYYDLDPDTPISSVFASYGVEWAV